MACGGDRSASRVPGKIRRSRTWETYPDDQHDEWMLVARGGAPRTPPAPVVARRSSEWRRSEASVDRRDDLATEKVGDDVKKLCREEMKQEG